MTVSSLSCFFVLVASFLTVYLMKEQGRSENTVRDYKYALNAFLTYIAEVKEMDPYKFTFKDCTPELVLGYVQYLKEEKKYTPATINQNIAAIKSYLKYAAIGRADLLGISSDIKEIDPLKIPKLQRPILTKEQLQCLFNLPPKSLKGNRDRVLLILLFDSAMRVSELVSLKIGDVYLKVQYPYIIVNGKGKKQRPISLNEKAAEHLKVYVANYHVEDPDPETPLFYTTSHGVVHQMTTRNVERIVTKYAEEVRKEFPDLPERVYPHMFRRTRATGMYRDDVPLELVSVALGHESTETTKTYAIPSAEQLRKAMQTGVSDEVADSSPDKLWKNHMDEIRKNFGLS